MKHLNRILALVAIVTAAILSPNIATAKWSKASRHFSYNGVEVEVINRSRYIGTMQDTYGYTIFANGKDEKLAVEWVCYGILKHGRKLVEVDEGAFFLQPKQTRKEVYSYGAGRYTYTDFDDYVVAIQVSTKDFKDPDYEETVPDPNIKEVSETTVPSNMTEIYNRILKHKAEGNISQKDYSDAIDVLEWQFNHNIKPVFEQMWKYQEKNDEASVNKVIAKNQKLLDKFSELGDIIEEADSKGLLNESNVAKLAKLKAEVDEYSL